MTLDETTRFRITNKFVSILGEEDAAKLMDAIPPIDWDRFATKEDIAAATILTKAEMDLEFANFRTEVAVQFAEVRSQMRTEFADIRTEMRTGFANLRAEFAHSMRVNTFTIIGSLAALMTVFSFLNPLLK
ncbi:MAG: hypothetical protein WCK23_08160 [Actinomycetes bacterium]